MMAIHRNIHRATAGAVALLLALVAPAAAEDVSVEATSGGKPVALRARLHAPAGAGPFPALVFVHGCSGWGAVQNAWADDLAPEGHVDAFAAIRMLQRRPQVDRERIGVIGWSHDGATTLSFSPSLPHRPLPARRRRALPR